jgi:uncharacterized DUF497 family protein
MRFVWDPRKARTNQRDHGVSFNEATTVFDDGLSVTIADPAHSWNEERFVTMGLSLPGRLLVVCYTEDDGHIRIISAREATGHERKQYEDETGP